jgi:hypothetical protein
MQDGSDVVEKVLDEVEVEAQYEKIEKDFIWSSFSALFVFWTLFPQLSLKLSVEALESTSLSQPAHDADVEDFALRAVGEEEKAESSAVLTRRFSSLSEKKEAASCAACRISCSKCCHDQLRRRIHNSFCRTFLENSMLIRTKHTLIGWPRPL